MFLQKRLFDSFVNVAYFRINQIRSNTFVFYDLLKVSRYNHAFTFTKQLANISRGILMLGLMT